MCNSDKPYIERTVTTVVWAYNPDYGNDRKCQCGHDYYRHFDTYDEMEPVGCKYCHCDEFVEAQPTSASQQDQK